MKHVLWRATAVRVAFDSRPDMNEDTRTMSVAPF